MQELGAQAATIMMQGAADYIRRNNIKDPDLDAVIAEMRAGAKVAVDEAMLDAAEAIRVNLPHVAEETFRATLRVAGINAAKRVLEK